MSRIMEPRTRQVTLEALKWLAALIFTCAVLYALSACSSRPMTVRTPSSYKAPLAASPASRFTAHVDTFTLNKYVDEIAKAVNRQADVTEALTSSLTGLESSFTEIAVNTGEVAKNTRGFLTITQALTGTGGTGAVGLLAWLIYSRRKASGANDG